MIIAASRAGDALAKCIGGTIAFGTIFLLIFLYYYMVEVFKAKKDNPPKKRRCGDNEISHGVVPRPNDRNKPMSTATTLCPYCECEVNEGFKFCPKCGEKLRDAESPVRTATPGLMQWGNVTADGMPRSSEIYKQAGVSLSIRGWFRRFVISPDVSARKCAAFLAIGISVCWLGWVLIDFSNGLDAINLRTSEYRQIYGCASPSIGEWLLFLVGAAIDLVGIVYAYYAWTELLDHIKRPSWNMSPLVAKTVAVIACVVFYCLFVLILTAIKGAPSGGQRLMCVWDYLIMVAGFKAIWRFFVGPKLPRQKTAAELAKEKKAKRNLSIRLYIYVGLGILAAIYICASMCHHDRLETAVGNKEKIHGRYSKLPDDVLKCVLDNYAGRKYLKEHFDLEKWESLEGRKYDLYECALRGKKDIDYIPIYSIIKDKDGCFIVDTNEEGKPYLDDKYEGGSVAKEAARRAYVRRMQK